jgi:hypothetical protein
MTRILGVILIPRGLGMCHLAWVCTKCLNLREAISEYVRYRAYLYRLSGASLGVLYVRIYRKNFFGIPKNIPKVRLFLFA